MTSISRRQLRDFLANEKPEVVADIGGAPSRHAYADICPSDCYDLESSPSFDICTSPLPQKYACIVCTDVFEHVFDPASAASYIGHSLLPGGVCFITTVSSWPEHKHPVDTYRYMEDGLRYLFRSLRIEKCWYEDDPDGGLRISLIARKSSE